MNWDMDYRTAYKAGMRTMLVSASVMIFGVVLDAVINWGIWLVVTGAVVFFLGLLALLIWFNCPRCGKNLYSRFGVPKYCPECGEPLDIPRIGPRI